MMNIKHTPSPLTEEGCLPDGRQGVRVIKALCLWKERRKSVNFQLRPCSC